MDTFPAFFPLAGRRVVIAGEGEAADVKARLFAGSPAEVIRLAGEEAFDPQRYARASLIFIASADRRHAERALSAARAANAPVNVVDRPDLSDFHTPAIVDRGEVVAAVGTTGAAPVLATLLRAEIERLIPPATGGLARLLAERREAIRAAFPDLAARRAFFRAALQGEAQSAVASGDLARAGELIDAAIANRARPRGQLTCLTVPEERDLITLRAVRALGSADVVVSGPEAEDLIARHARRDVERLEAAFATRERLDALVAEGSIVVLISAAAA